MEESNERTPGVPSVSVLLPTHNRPVWLRVALESVLGGDFRDFEVIVSNSGRPAHTHELHERVDDARVRWVEQPPGFGARENFLAALALARGRYVAVLHDDDWWDPRLLASLVPPLEEHPEAVVAFADHWLVDADGRIDVASTDETARTSGRAEVAPGLHRPLHQLAAREEIPIVGAVFRREAIPPDSFPPEVGSILDVWVGFLLAVTGGAGYRCPERLLYYRVHGANDSAWLESLRGAVYCQRRMLNDTRMIAQHDELRRRLATREQYIGAALLRQGARSQARSYLRHAMQLRPSWKGVGAWGASWFVPKSILGRL
jgi:glycosyltransferase involved in cell wall biosynthesis